MNSIEAPARFPSIPFRPRRTARWLPIAVAALMLALDASCTDQNARGPTSVGATSNSAVEVSPDSPKWNRFVVDVAIVTEGGSIVTAKERRVSLGSSYRLVKVRDTTGRWVTEHAFADLAPRANDRLRLRPARLARVVTVAGEMPVFYDALGRRMSTPGTPTFPRSAGSTEFPVSAVSPKTIQLRPAAQSMGLADTTREWLDRYILTSAGAERVRGRLMAAAGTADRSIPGKARFIIEHGDIRSEIEVNDRTGTVDVLRTLLRGKLMQGTVREYERRNDGALILKRERITRPDPKSGKATTTTVVTFANIRVQESY